LGGWGSGRRWASKETTGDYLQLDVRKLQRCGVLERRYTFSWKWSRYDGEPIGTISILPEADRLILSYRDRRPGGEWTDQNYSVLLDRTPCQYGGERVWIRCPAKGCGRRVAILYGGSIFACRNCYRLAYPSQRQSVGDRADARAWAIRERCGGWGSLFDPVFRPKGMHRRTFRRLEQAYEMACGLSAVSIAARLGMDPEQALALW
jgi:hypothetical protein